MKSTLPPALTNHRYKQLDSLRGIAALAVFLTHYLGLKAALPFFACLKMTPLGILLNGNGAVMFFFVLSGFVLGLPFVDNEKPLMLISFYVKRIFRIYPALIFALGFSIILKEFVFDKASMLSFTGWMHNFWNWDWSRQNITEIIKTFLLIGPDFNTNLIDPPVWSLVIEMKMSVILPFFIVIISRNSPALNVIFLFVIAWLTYQYNAWAISVFYIGILMAKYREPLITMMRAKGAVFTAIAILVFIFLYNNNIEFPVLLEHISLPLKYTWSKYLMALGSAIIIIVVLAGKKTSHFFEHPVFVFFGDISYSFYLIHAPLILTMASLFTCKFALSPVYIFLSALAAAILYSYLVFVYIEKPFQKFAKLLIVKYKWLNKIDL